MREQQEQQQQQQRHQATSNASGNGRMVDDAAEPNSTGG